MMWASQLTPKANSEHPIQIPACFLRSEETGATGGKPTPALRERMYECTASNPSSGSNHEPWSYTQMSLV